MKPFGPHHCFMRSGSVKHFHTSSRGASNTRLMTNSELWPAASGGSAITIQPMPKRSATMPKRGEKNVLPSGICTCPPSASALNMRSASASSLAETDSAKPWNIGLPWARPSDAMICVLPMRKQECMILFSLPGAHMPGLRLGAFA